MFAALSVLLGNVVSYVRFLVFLTGIEKKCTKTDTKAEKSLLFFPLTGKKESDIFFLSDENSF